ncbi:MAG: enoyl-CoA hydratase/isomerase family protein [Acidimicrobiales bacterium]
MSTASNDRAYETLEVETYGSVTWVTLNRPEVHNAFNASMQTELRHLWRALRSDDSVRVIVLTGAGEKAFCTGIDRTETIGDTTSETHEDPDAPEQAASSPEAIGETGRPRRNKIVGAVSTPFMFDDPGANIGPKSCDLWKPVIAAVNGMACGGAFYMLGEADFIIAAEHATFFDPHVTYGMTAAFEPMHMLQRMPLGEILRLSLMGNNERLSARRAYEIGLVSQIVPYSELTEAASWAAQAIASQPPLAVQGTLRAIWAARELSRSQALALGFAFVGLGTDAESIREGQNAFASGTRSEWRLR